MAFTQDVGNPQVSTASIAPEGDTSNAVLARGLESIVGLAGGLGTAISQDKKALATDQVVGQAYGGLVELEAERDYWRGRDTNLQQQMTSIAGDGEITAAERETLKALEVEKSFLDQAKKSGVLSRQGYSTRYNALYRSALASADNLGIQGPISELFLQNRSLKETAPVLDDTSTKITAAMDAQFGVGNWNAENATDWLAKNQQASLILRDSSTSPNRISAAFNIFNQTAINKMLNDEKNGVVITEQDRLDYSLQLNNLVQGTVTAVNDKRAKLIKMGQYTDGRAKELDESIATVVALRDTAVADINDPKKLGQFTVGEMLRRHNEAADAMATAGIAPTLRIMNTVNGGVNGSSMLSLLNSDSDQLWELMAANNELYSTAKEAKAAMLKPMIDALSGAESWQSLESKGLLHPDLHAWLVSKTNNQPAKTPEDAEVKIENLGSLTAVAGNTDTTKQRLATATNIIDRTVDSAKAQGKVTGVATQTKKVLETQAQDLLTQAKKRGFFVLQVDKSGKISVGLRGELTEKDLGNTTDGRMFKSLREQAALYSALAEKAVSHGLVNRLDIPQMFGTFDVVSGQSGTEAELAAPAVRAEFSPTTQADSGLAGVAGPVDIATLTAATIESSMNPDAVNQGSGAAGLLQITPMRLKDLPEGFDPKDPNQAIGAYQAHTLEAKSLLSKNNLPADDANTYILWQQGNRGGLDILSNQDKKISEMPKSRQTNMKSNMPPVSKEIETVKDWVDGWRSRYNKIKAKQEGNAPKPAVSAANPEAELLDLARSLPAGSTIEDLVMFLEQRNK